MIYTLLSDSLFNIMILRAARVVVFSCSLFILIIV